MKRHLLFCLEKLFSIEPNKLITYTEQYKSLSYCMNSKIWREEEEDEVKQQKKLTGISSLYTAVTELAIV